MIWHIIKVVLRCYVFGIHRHDGKKDRCPDCGHEFWGWRP
jgi:rRNA maturation endonuclease Nob1